ncbi:hypothetical protein D043_1591B, partial [Vibrio parahaemolyticus EKP-021]
YVFFNLLILND